MLSVKFLSKKAPMLCIRFLPRKKSDVKRQNLYPKDPHEKSQPLAKKSQPLSKKIKKISKKGHPC